VAWTRKYYLKKQLFDLEVKGQGPTKVVTVRDAPPDNFLSYSFPVYTDLIILIEIKESKYNFKK
jgi:hypothetical protein